jgi:hypothetical protein
LKRRTVDGFYKSDLIISWYNQFFNKQANFGRVKPEPKTVFLHPPNKIIAVVYQQRFQNVVTKYFGAFFEVGG